MKTSTVLGIAVVVLGGYFILRQTGAIQPRLTAAQQAALMLSQAQASAATGEKGASRSARIVQGATTGASIGIIGGPWGIGIGAAAGAVGGMFIK